MKKELVKTDKLKGYAMFLLEHHLDDFVKNDLSRGSEADLPLLKLFSHLPENELFGLFKKLASDFLKEIIEGKVIEGSFRLMEKIRQDRHENLRKDQIMLEDIALVYNTRKHSFLTFLPLYTKDPAAIIEIAKEIEDVHAFREHLAFEAYTYINTELLKTSEESFKNLAEASFEGIAIHDGHVILETNKVAAQMYGYSREEIIGKSLLDFSPEEEQEKLLKNARNGFEGPYETLGKRKDGSLFPVEIVGRKILYKGREVRVAGLRDITERKKQEEERNSNYQKLLHLNNELQDKNEELATMQEELRESNTRLEERVKERTKELEVSERRFRALANFMPQMVWIRNALGEVEYVNDKWISYTGMDLETTRNNNGIPSIHGDDLEKMVSLWEEAKKKGNMYECIFRIKRISDGMYRWHISRALPLKDEQGSVIQWYGSTTDIHDQKTAEEKLAYQSKLIKTITDNASSCLFMMDREGYCTFMNPAGEKMFGYTFEEIRERPLHYMIHHHRPDGSFYPREDCPIDRALPENYDIRAHEDVFIRKDGSMFPVSCAASPIFENGIPVSTVVEVRDITQEKHFKETILAKNVELTRINNDLDNFIYTASHDLKAPVSNIEGLMNTLYGVLADEEKLNEDTESIIQMINSSVTRFQKTLKDLTEISKVQRNIQEDIHEVYAKEVLDEIRLDIHDLINKSGAVINFDSSACPVIKFSRVNFRSILYNVITNAIKYRSPERPPVIDIICSKEGSSIVLEITDNGLGISKDNQDKIFNMFKRFHNHVEGTGVGLYIVKRIIENAGGKVIVESQEGAGTTMKLYIPEHTYESA